MTEGGSFGRRRGSGDARTLPAGAALSAAQRDVLHGISTRRGAQYDTAFALLSDDERRYFEAPLISRPYAVDHFKLDSTASSNPSRPAARRRGDVLERIEFFDAVRQSPASATAKVAYGIGARQERKCASKIRDTHGGGGARKLQRRRR